MGQDRDDQPLHVVGDAVGPAGQERRGLGRPEERAGRAGAGPEGEGVAAPGGLGDGHHVPHDGRVHLHPLGCLLEAADLRGREDRGQVREDAARLPRYDAPLGLGRGVADLDPHQEAVHLGLGERMGPVILEGVLGRDHHEGSGERVGLVVQRDLRFVHRLQEAGLGLGAGPVDLVGQDDVGEQRARPELKGPGLGVEDVDPEDVGGEQVAGELDPLERAAKRAGQSLGERGLPHPRDILDEEVAPGEERDEGEPDLVRLAHQHPLELSPEAGEGLGGHGGGRGGHAGSLCKGWQRPEIASTRSRGAIIVPGGEAIFLERG